MVMYGLGFGMLVRVGGMFRVAVELAGMVDSDVGGMFGVAVEDAGRVDAGVMGADVVPTTCLAAGMLQAFKVTIRIARAD